MSLVIFPVTPLLKKVVKHAMLAKKWRKAYSFDGSTAMPKSLLFVHDQGVYLMSAGLPVLQDPKKKEKDYSLCSYAQGCHPVKDKYWHSNARELVGGDDFAEAISAVPIAQFISLKADTICMELTARSIRFAGTKDGKPL